MSDDALGEILRSPLDDPPSPRRRGERRAPDAPAMGQAAGDDALREVLRSPLDDPPPDRRGAWAALAALVAAAGCGFGATVGIRALVPGETADIAATTTTLSATTTTLPGPAVSGGWIWSMKALLAAAISGLVFGAAMGVDFPESNRRFARLA